MPYELRAPRPWPPKIRRMLFQIIVLSGKEKPWLCRNIRDSALIWKVAGAYGGE